MPIVYYKQCPLFVFGYMHKHTKNEVSTEPWLRVRPKVNVGFARTLFL